MIMDYLRGPWPSAGNLYRLKSPHVLNLISSIKLKNKTSIFFQLREREGGNTPHPHTAHEGPPHPHIAHGLDVVWGLCSIEGQLKPHLRWSYRKQP